MKVDAKKKIDDYFSGSKLESKATKKIKKISMSHRIRLKENRKRFCKKCYSDLKNGKVKLNKKRKTTICKACGFANIWMVK